MIDEKFYDELKKSKHGLDARRNTKWKTSMMLTEHVKMLRDYYEEVKKVPRPILGEWDLHAMEETIQIAIKQQCDVLLKVWRDGEIKLYGGAIVNLDLKNRVLELDNPFGIKSYQFDEIVDVTATE